MAGMPNIGQKKIPLDEWKRFVRVADWWDRTFGHKPPSVAPPKGGFVGFQFLNTLSPRVVIDDTPFTLPLIAQDTTPALWSVPNTPGWTADAATDVFTCKIAGWYRVTILFHTNVYTARGTRVLILHTPLGAAEVTAAWAARLHPPYNTEDLPPNEIAEIARYADSNWCTIWRHCCEDDTVRFQVVNYGGYYPNGDGNQTEAWFYQISFERLSPLL